MTDTVDRSTPADARPRPPARPGHRRPVRRLLIVSHRWLSLVLGIVLLAITTSGAVLLYPAHSGYVVNGWWRLVWLGFALSPLLLALTGISTWLVRLRTRRSRRHRRRPGAAATT